MARSRTSGAASVATACRCCEHADHEAARLQMPESWIEEYDRSEGKAAAFGRRQPCGLVVLSLVSVVSRRNSSCIHTG